MENKLEYIELNDAHLPEEIIKQFDYGNNDMTEYLCDSAYKDSINGNGVTYILVDKKDYLNKEIKFIYAYVTISAHALNFYENGAKYYTKKIDENGNVLSSVSCIEIKMFAIEKALIHQKADGIRNSEYYSTVFLKWFLEKLYYMSMSVIGFQMIFLRSNKEGEKLYRRLKFDNCLEHIITYDQCSEECIPMFLTLKNLEYYLYD